MPFCTGNTFENIEHDSLPRHLWIVISDTEQWPDEVVIVNFTTSRNPSWDDKSCIVQAGEHAYVNHRTYVNYRDAKIVSLPDLKRLKTKGLLIRNSDVSDALLDRIRKGAESSKFTQLKIIEVLKRQGCI